MKNIKADEISSMSEQDNSSANLKKGSEDNVQNSGDDIDDGQRTLFCVITTERNISYYIVEAICAVLMIISFVLVAVVIDWTAFVWRFYVAFGCFMAFCIVIAEVNHRHKFNSMTAYFHNWRYYVIIMFFILALCDFIILQLSDLDTEKCDYNDSTKNDCPILNPDKHGIRIITRLLTLVCGTLFLCSLMAYWQKFSFQSAHSDWVVALLYMTVIGAVFLYFARCLEPPPPDMSTDKKESYEIKSENNNEESNKENERQYEWSWHQEKSLMCILVIIVKVMIFVILFFVVMGAIVLALFGDAAKASGSLGTPVAIIIFSIIAHIIMITPLAPGSVVDVCAGFLFVTLFVSNEGWSIPLAFGISLLMTIVLHFSGSCAQYFVGKMRFVQIWANKALPPEMLAASDSVLKTANWFKVGIVGQVFMDTANGLNQGRMNMAFCTQFWSEYASIPSAIGLVSLGTVLAIPSFNSNNSNSYSWAEDAIPLVIMFATLWQMVASSWGAKELLASSGTVSYWTALEKWATVQHFYKLGYVPTRDGWKTDCYDLGKAADDKTCLFDSIQKYRKQGMSTKHKRDTSQLKIKQTESCGTIAKRLCATPEDEGAARDAIREEKKLTDESLSLRKKHWRRFDDKRLDALVKKDILEKVDAEVSIENYFKTAIVNTPRGYLHIVLALIIFGTGVGCYMGVARGLGLSEAVKSGVYSLRIGDNATSIYGWICLSVFWTAVGFYFWKELRQSVSSMGDSMKFMCSGCKIEDSYETVFNTPNWDTEWTPKEFSAFQLKSQTMLNTGLFGSKSKIEEEIDLSTKVDKNDNENKEVKTEADEKIMAHDIDIKVQNSNNDENLRSEPQTQLSEHSTSHEIDVVAVLQSHD